MNDAFLKLYEEELGHIRDLGADFGNQYPKIAGRLGMTREGCDDPFVERMIEGFAFLAARVRTKLDSEYQNFSEALLESVYPQLLGPVPSMSIVDLCPDEKLTGKFVIPRCSVLTSHLGADEDTRCEFRTAHEVELQPIKLSDSVSPRYHLRDIDTLRLPNGITARAAIRLRISHLQADKEISSLDSFESLTLHLAGNMDAAGSVYEELSAHCTHIFLRTVSPGRSMSQGSLVKIGDGIDITPIGFAPDESLLPTDSRSFDGYRLLREYTVMPQRFMFIKLGGPKFAHFVSQCSEQEFDIVFLLDRSREELGRYVDQHRFRLHATPAINLFQRRADLVRLTENTDSAHVVIDKTRPLAYEVYQILDVVGSGEQLDYKVRFEPFYRKANTRGVAQNFYTVHRERRKLTHREARFGFATEYLGSEVYLHLVDSAQHLQRSELTSISVVALCTNRHIPLRIPIHQHDTDFFLDAGIPVTSVKCLVSPTRPVHSPVEGAIAWRLISQLSLNYLSLVDNEQGAAVLRSILELYSEPHNEESTHWTKSIVAVKSGPIVRRHLSSGPVAFVRGLEVVLTIDDARLAGYSPYVFGAMMSRFLSRYVSINSFVDTVIETNRRGVIGRWAGLSGLQPTL